MPVQVQEPDDVVYAVTLSRAAQVRLCQAAKISQIPEWQGQGEPEPVLREITRQLTGLEFDDLVKSEEVLRRVPYVCFACGGTFTLEEFGQVRHVVRVNGFMPRGPGLPSPIKTGQPLHVSCAPRSPIRLTDPAFWATP